MKKGLVERLKDDHVVLCGEGYVFELERRGYVRAGDFVPEVVLEFPDAVKELHREFLRAGADVILALTYYAHRDKLKLIDRESDLEEINRMAIRQAHDVAREGDALVAGNLCNTWVYDPSNSKETEKAVRAMYEEQTQWAVDEAVDFIVAETLNYMREAEIALEVIKSAGLPSVINFNPFQTKTGDGFEFHDACRRLGDMGATVVGLNCGCGPHTMLPALEQITSNVDCHVSALPVAYATDDEHRSFLTLRKPGRRHGFPIELESFLLTRYEMADFAVRARNTGARYIGICCGGAPHHLRAMAEALGRTTPASRYSPDLSRHAIFGDDGAVKSFEKSRFSRERTQFQTE